MIENVQVNEACLEAGNNSDDSEVDGYGEDGNRTT